MMPVVERPEPIAALERILNTAEIAHLSIFDLHRRLFDAVPDDYRGREGSLAESAAIVATELPALAAAAKRLQRRWWDESVLDPPSADRTVAELKAELERIAPSANELLARQRDIARELRSILDEAKG